MHPYVQTKSCRVQELRVNILSMSQGVLNGKSIACSSSRRSCASRRSPAGQHGPSRADPAAEHPLTSRSCGPWNNGPLESSERNFAFIGAGARSRVGRFWCSCTPASSLAILCPAPEPQRVVLSSSLHPEVDLFEPLFTVKCCYLHN